MFRHQKDKEVFNEATSFIMRRHRATLTFIARFRIKGTRRNDWGGIVNEPDGWQKARQFRRQGRMADARAALATAHTASEPAPASALIEGILADLALREPVRPILGRIHDLSDRENLTARDRAALLLADGIVRNRQDQTHQSIALFTEALNIAIEVADRELEVDVRSELGVALLWMGQITPALTTFLRALSIASEEEDKAGLAQCWSNIGRLYLETRDFDAAAHYLRFSLAIRSDWPAGREHARLCQEMATAELGREEDAAALEAIDQIDPQALANAGRYLQFSVMRTKCLALHRSGSPDAASCLDAAKSLADLDDDWQRAVFDLTAGEISLSVSPSEALDHLKRASDYFRETEDVTWLIESELLRVTGLSELGRKDEAESVLSAAADALAQDDVSGRMGEIEALSARYHLRTRLAAETGRRLTSSNIKNSDGYMILETVGKGSFGTVFRAYDTLRGREVAYKKMRFDNVYDIRRRDSMADSMRRELESAASLHHPGIAEVLAFGRDGSGNPYIVMEFLEGKTLRHQMELPFDRNIFSVIGSKICHALQAAHDQSVIHRDLKPENIILISTDSPVIVDFGMAAFDEAEDIAAAAGTRPYMAPEHQKGKEASIAMDLFAIGVIFYEWIVGQRPFSPSAPMSRWAYAQRYRKLGGELDKRLASDNDLKELTLSLLRYNPARRPASALAVADALDKPRV